MPATPAAVSSRTTDGAGRRISPLPFYALLLALLAGLFTATGPASPAAAGEAETIHSLLNDARAANGKPALSRNSGLDTVAVAWAKQMAADNSMYHNPNVGSQIPSGWTSWGENVAHGYPTGGVMHDAWMGSPGHYKNIMGDFTDIGIAFVEIGGTTWGVEVFATYPGGGERTQAAPPANREPAAEERPAAEPDADERHAAEQDAAANAAAEEAEQQKAAEEKAAEEQAAEEQEAAAEKKAAKQKAAEETAAATQRATEETAERVAVKREAVAEKRVAAEQGSAGTVAQAPQDVPEATSVTREVRTANPVLLAGLGTTLLVALLLLSPTIRKRIFPARSHR